MMRIRIAIASITGMSHHTVEDHRWFRICTSTEIYTADRLFSHAYLSHEIFNANFATHNRHITDLLLRYRYNSTVLLLTIQRYLPFWRDENTFSTSLVTTNKNMSDKRLLISLTPRTADDNRRGEMDHHLVCRIQAYFGNPKPRNSKPRTNHVESSRPRQRTNTTR